MKTKTNDGSWEQFQQQVKEMVDTAHLHYAARAIMNWLTWKHSSGTAWILTSGHQNVIYTSIKELSDKQEDVFKTITDLYNCRWIEKEEGEEGLVFAIIPHDPNVFDPYKEPLAKSVQKLKDAGFMIGTFGTKLTDPTVSVALADYWIDVWDYPEDVNHGQRNVLVNPTNSHEEVVVTRLYFVIE